MQMNDRDESHSLRKGGRKKNIHSDLINWHTLTLKETASTAYLYDNMRIYKTLFVSFSY